MPRGISKNPELTSYKKSINNSRYWLGKKRPNINPIWLKDQPILRGQKSPNWKGDNIGYNAIHLWLRKTFKKTSCEKCGSDKNIQWAKLKDKPYKRVREYYWQLCASCHTIYDNPQGNGRFKKGIPSWNKGLKMPYKPRIKK